MGEDQFDVDLDGEELLEEVELTTDLIVAAMRATGRAPGPSLARHRSYTQ